MPAAVSDGFIDGRPPSRPALPFPSLSSAPCSSISFVRPQTPTWASIRSDFLPMPLDLSSAKRGDGDAEFVLRTIQSDLARASGRRLSVSTANGLPLDLQSRHTRVAGDGGSTVVRAHTTRVSPGYLDTMRVPLLRGRGITPDDQTGSEPVVVITRALALRLFPNDEPVGARLKFALDGSQAPVGSPMASSVGALWLSRRSPLLALRPMSVDAYLGPPEPQLFVPLAQHATPQVYVIVTECRGADRR